MYSLLNSAIHHHRLMLRSMEFFTGTAAGILYPLCVPENREKNPVWIKKAEAFLRATAFIIPYFC